MRLQCEHIKFKVSNEGLSEGKVKGVNKLFKWSESVRCRASERSELCERTNVASDQVAYQKRNYLQLETGP